MRRLLFFLVLVAGCGTESKNHCDTASDCLDGDQCVSGLCQGGDPDGCGASHDVCAADATCTDTGGALACVCAPGFTGDGTTCADVDECAADHACAAHATCTNQPGTFACACSDGFTGDGTSYCTPATFTKVISAGGFSCGLAGDGGVYCWGSGYYGDLGNGSTLAETRPTQVGTATDWTDLSVRTNQVCGLRADHSMWCWGYGATGQLGDGKNMSSATPIQVVSDKPGVGWKALSVNRQVACGIHTDGSAACWGNERYPVAIVSNPTAVDAHTDWTKVAAGAVRCGLRDGGHLYCWGLGREGELGLGDGVTQQDTPMQVGTDTWRDVVVGYYNVCGIRSDGALLCWGNHPLVTGALQYGTAPTQVGTATDWESISLAADSIVGLRAGGKAYAWGGNSSGQLAQPLAIVVAAPAPLGDPAMTWRQISAGNVHGCGVATTGQAYCWGYLSEGTLGDGETTTWLTPTALTTDKWSSLAVGIGVRGVRSDGALMASGFDIYDGVGFGDTAPVWAPARIGLEHWTSVVTSHDATYNTCALRAGVPYCWGDNEHGQGGIGTVDTPLLAPTAVQVPTGSQWREIAIGTHSCAIRSDGALFCWGSNDSGELGDGTVSGDPVTAVPATPIAGTWRHVVTAAGTTCAIADDHTLWCWGITPAGTYGVPTKVDAATDWDTITAQAGNNTGNDDQLALCAIKTTGTLWCWGVLDGRADAATSTSPLQIGSDTHWTSISLGAERCGTKTDGTLWCWDNSDVLGDGTPYTTNLADSTTIRTLTPTQIGHDTDWAQVVTNGQECGLKTDGSVLCWGLGAAPIENVRITPVAVK